MGSFITHGLTTVVLSFGLLLPAPILAQTTSTDPSPTETPTTTAERPELTAELKSCLVKAVGQSAFDEISSGARNPTEAEVVQGSPCFDRHEIIRGSGPLPDPASTLAGPTRECLGKLVGAENVDQFVRAQLRVERSVYEQARTCFGPGLIKGSKVKRLDSDLEQCLIKAVGDAAFDEIGTGVRPPTQEELQKGRTCFDAHGAPFGPPAGGPGGEPPPGYVEPPPELKACIKGILGGDFHEIRRRPTPEEEQRLQSECFSKFAPVGGPGGPRGFPPEVAQCLREKLGPAFEEVINGARPPQGQELEGGKECFQKFKGSFHFGGPGPHGQPPSPEVEACVVKVLGGNFRDLKTPPTPEQEQQLRDECFKGGPGGFGGPPELSVELENCLREKGIDFKAGPPSPEKMRDGEECFRKHGAPFGPGPGGPGGPPPGPPPNLSEETKNCLAEKLGGAENVEKMFRGELRPENPSLFHDCFKGQGGPGGGPGGPGGPGPSPEQRACVARITGSEEPGPGLSEEQQRKIGEECFKGRGGPGGPGGGPPGGGQFGLAPEAEKCVRDKLGGKTFSDLGRPPTDEEREATKDCFKGQGGPGGPGPGGSGPPPGGSGGPGGPGFKPAGEDCGRKVLGDRYEQIKQGGGAPSPEDITKIQECIKGAGPPPPPR